MAKRILLVNDHIYFGGGGDAVFRLERRFLESQGFEVYTFSHGLSRSADASDRDFVHVENQSRVFSKAGKYLGSRAAAIAFRRALEQIDPQVIHLHGLSQYPLSIYGQLQGQPTFQTLHGPAYVCATGWGCLKKNSNPCEFGVGWKCWNRGCVPLWQLPMVYSMNHRVLDLARKKVDRFLCRADSFLRPSDVSD